MAASNAVSPHSSACATTSDRHNSPFVLAALALIVAGYLAFGVLLSPLGVGVISGKVSGGLVLSAMSMGVLLGQPVLAAIVAVFWPTRRLVRTSAGVALLLAISYAMVLGEFRNRGSVDINTPIAPAVEFFTFMVLLGSMRWLRRWRMIAPTAAASSSEERYSLRALWAIITLACVLFAAGRWALAPVMWPSQASEWLKVMTSVIAFSIPCAIAFLVILPGMVWTLGRQRRGQALLLMLVAMLGIVGGLTALELSSTTGSQTAVIIVVNSSIATGAFGSVLLVLFVLRVCGYRLVRE